MERLGQLTFTIMVIHVLLNPTYAVQQQANNMYSLTVDGSDVLAPLNRFWRSTGFCPPQPHEKFRDYVLSDDELQNIALIGSVARQGIKQVRIHWLLDLIKVTGESPSALTYDFTDLDTLLDWLKRSQLQPGFEIMGNPSSYFTTFDNKTQVYLWKDLVQQLASRYVKRYGLDEVSQWNFETWNEPSIHDFDTLQISLQGFMNYYDACSEGLKAVSPKLRLGGPGDGCHASSEYCWAFLGHCATGTNYFTGESGVRLDYISFHHKGAKSSATILETSNLTIYAIRVLFPELDAVEIFNDEADPLVGWSSEQTWRADMRYAAMVVKVISQHQYTFLTSAKMAKFTRYALLSNDNGFMNWDPMSTFDERTLTARFRMNLTNPRSVEMVKKPVLSVMSLLAMLGENQLSVVLKPYGSSPTLGALASSHIPDPNDPHDSWEIAILIYYSDDTLDTTHSSEIQLQVVNINPPNASAGDLVTQYFTMDNDQSNPYFAWVAAGSPQYPSKDLLKRMRSQQEPVSRVYETYNSASFGHAKRIDMTFRLNMPAVSLVHVCQLASVPPPQVTGLWLHNVTSSEVLVVWKDVNVRCLSTYTVLYSTSGVTGKFSAANSEVILISTSFIHALTASDIRELQGTNSTVTYEVYAVDYSGRKGLVSEPVSIVL